MTTSYQKSLLDLIEAMKGHSSIKGWDILVSYDLRKINTVLQKRAEQDKYRLDVPEFTSPYHSRHKAHPI
jgi:hypothetical protein